MSEKMVVGRCVPIPPGVGPTGCVAPHVPLPPPARAVTEARVAAAFEAWCSGWADEIDFGQEEGAGSPFWDREAETHQTYAKRLAAGLFKYLELDAQALTEGEGT